MPRIETAAALLAFLMTPLSVCNAQAVTPDQTTIDAPYKQPMKPAGTIYDLYKTRGTGSWACDDDRTSAVIFRFLYFSKSKNIEDWLSKFPRRDIQEQALTDNGCSFVSSDVPLLELAGDRDREYMITAYPGQPGGQERMWFVYGEVLNSKGQVPPFTKGIANFPAVDPEHARP